MSLLPFSSPFFLWPHCLSHGVLMGAMWVQSPEGLFFFFSQFLFCSHVTTDKEVVTSMTYYGWLVVVLLTCRSVVCSGVVYGVMCMLLQGQYKLSLTSGVSKVFLSIPGPSPCFGASHMPASPPRIRVFKHIASGYQRVD